MRNLIPTLGVAAVVALAGFADSAQSQTRLTFSASNAGGSGIFTVDVGDGFNNPDGSWFWMLPSMVDIVDTNTLNVIATIRQGTMFFQPNDPGGIGGTISTSFVMTAGSDGATDVDIFTENLSVGSFLNASGVSSGTLETTDNGGNGSTVTAGHAGGTIRSMYNGGTLFNDLIAGPLAAGPGGSNSTNDNSGGFQVLGATVSSMQVAWAFTVTAGDQVGGTSVFNTVPAPASAALIALGGLVSVRRRR